MPWILVSGWERFQHYRDRDPAWIKLYIGLRSNAEWCELNLHQRGVLVTIWLEYAASNGRLSVELIRRRLGLSFRMRTLETLNDAGFIEFSDSKPLALRARAKEKEKDLPKKVSKPKTSNERKKITGYRFVRGSHSGTYVPDPNGTDTPPYPVPGVKEIQ